MRFSDAEWIVMEALWRGAGPSSRERSSARDVIERLGKQPGWAYTTVKTMLTRLVEKGAGTEELKGNVATYRPKVSRLAGRQSGGESPGGRALRGAERALRAPPPRGGPPPP